LRPCNATKEERQFLKTAAIEDARLDAVLEAKKHEVDAEAEDDVTVAEPAVMDVADADAETAEPTDPGEPLDATGAVADELEAGENQPLGPVALVKKEAEIMLSDEMAGSRRALLHLTSHLVEPTTSITSNSRTASYHIDLLTACQLELD